jgi:hypothetical protein
VVTDLKNMEGSAERRRVQRGEDRLRDERFKWLGAGCNDLFLSSR